MKKIIFAAAAVIAVLASCSKIETSVPLQVPQAGPDQFTACFQDLNDGASTRIYLNQNGQMTWEYGYDYISIFSGSTHSEYLATESSYTNGYSRPNYAVFSKVEGTEQNTGLNLDRHYAVYPSNPEATLTADGILSTTIVSNTFAAVTKDKADHMLYFKNLMGYLYFTIEGSGIISGIRFYGNNGEVLRGAAKARLSSDSDPVLAMEPDGDKEIVYSDLSLDLEKSKVTFRLPLPPVTFSKGFTLEVTGVDGQVFTFASDQSRTVVRNQYYEVDPVEVNCGTFSGEDGAQAVLDEIYADLGRPSNPYGGALQPDCYGFLMDMFSNDAEGSDMVLAPSGYNWFSVSSELSRNSNYRNPNVRNLAPWMVIKKANSIIAGLAGYDSMAAGYMVGQAKALRAYAYLALANDFQFGPATAADKPCVPIFDESVKDESLLRSATVREVYNFINSDLAAAARLLNGFIRTSAAQIDLSVVYALSARSYLQLGQWRDAQQYASMAAEGFTPASIAEVSVPAFMDISEHNWIWGYDMTPEIASEGIYATTSSWLRSFSGDSYAGWGQTYAMINLLLYDQIPVTDVRKGWWVDDALESPNLENLVWDEFSGQAIGPAQIGDKTPFTPFTNVKFGCNPVGTMENAEDMPLVRVEEMILIQAECAARLGNADQAEYILSSFVRTYRNPEYDLTASGRDILDEIWLQRRIELWGEGFGRGDIVRLGKPLVRFIPDRDSNVPGVYQFNLEPGDLHLIVPIGAAFLERCPEATPNYDKLSAPESQSGGDLRDGVTD